jgi:hypothetical protein
MFCGNCGGELAEGALFCPNCGASVEQHTSDPQPVPQITFSQEPTSGSRSAKKLSPTQTVVVSLVTIVVGVVVVVLILGSGASTHSRTAQKRPLDNHSMYVSRATFKGVWPFTVKRGTLKCILPSQSVIFTSSGRTYAVNGMANSATDYPPIDSIWARDPKPLTPGYYEKKSIGDVIDAGLKLCGDTP